MTICEHCKKEFKPKTRKTRFCSKSCINKDYRAKNKEKFEKYYRDNKESLQEYKKTIIKRI